MLITPAFLSALWTGFNVKFNGAFTGAPSAYKDVAMIVPSKSRETTYAWLGQVPRLREWIGDRQLKSLAAYGYSVVNKVFESTLSLKRVDIEDDNVGMFATLLAEMGRSAGEHPDVLIFDLLGNGFTTACYDQQNFFDTEHPVDPHGGGAAVVSNMQAGDGPAWFLLDTSRAVKPLIYQERIPYELQRIDGANDEHVVMKDEYIYGVRGRSNAGFGLWQLAYGSKAPLTPTNYAAARAAMQALKGEDGKPLGIRPDTLVIPTAIEGAGLRLINNQLTEDGGTNEWMGTAKLIVTPWLNA